MTTRLQRPTNRQLADILLGEPIEDWLRARRDEGRSLREIAALLSERTSGRVVLSHQAVNRWLQESTQRSA